MASRSLVLAVSFVVVAAGPMAGCLDKVLGRGDLTVVLEVSTQPSFEANGVNYVNANAEFADATMLVSQVKMWPSAGEGETLQPVRQDVNTFLNLAGEEEREMEVLTLTFAEGSIEKVSLLTVPFNATRPDGTKVPVSIIQQPNLWEYIVPVPATIDAGATTTYALSLMIARRAGDTNETSYFLTLPPGESGPR